MYFDTIKKNYWKKIAIGLGVLVLILIVLITNGTFAKYEISKSVPLIQGTINYKPYDFKIMAMYQADENGEYEEVEVMPSMGYIINEEKSYCYTKTKEEPDNTAVLKTVDGNHVVGNLKKSSKCYLWFDVYINSYSARETLLASRNINRRLDFSDVLTASSTNVIYETEDNDGISYYFAGAVTDNWIYFAGYYWRIIRINGDGSIRVIYNGISNATTGEETQIGTSLFNNYNNDNAYVGYMYGTTGASTYEATHANNNNSTIKNVLESWYETDLINVSEYIDEEAGFCGDRTSFTNQGTISGGGYNNETTFYGAYTRIEYSKNPTLKCINDNDIYTTNSSFKGNKKLSYPIGLITADEMIFAGGVPGVTNKTYYLNSGQYFWTITPAYHYSGGTTMVARVYRAYPNTGEASSGGTLGNHQTNGSSTGVRPVINLRSDLILTGSGTSTDPYIPHLP